jgi:23S rRNA (cytosine1962-C5)-methyltransferase
MEMMRTSPDIEENQRPEVDDRQAIGVDWPVSLLGHEIVHHAKEARSQEEADRVVAVPPLRQRILNT